MCENCHEEQKATAELQTAGFYKSDRIACLLAGSDPSWFLLPRRPSPTASLPFSLAALWWQPSLRRIKGP